MTQDSASGDTPKAEETVGPERRMPWGRIPRARTVGIAMLAAGALAAGVAGVEASADTSASPAPGTSAAPGEPAPGASGPRDGRRGGLGGHGFRGHGGLGPLGRFGALHGEFVAPSSGGGYQTVNVQRGEVTEVSATSITLRSEDGFTKKYTVNADTLVKAARDGISTVKTKDQVHLVAVKNGNSAEAVSVVDVTRLRNSHKRFSPPAPTR